MKLLWYLGDWWLWAFFLFALLVMPAMAKEDQFILPLIASLSLIATQSPDFKKYQAIGLGSKIWNEHRRILVVLSTLAAALGALNVQKWWSLPVYAAAARGPCTGTVLLNGAVTPLQVPNPQADSDGSPAPWPGKPSTAGRSRHGVLRVWRKQSGLSLAGLRRKSRCLVSLASSYGQFLSRYSPQRSAACVSPYATTRCSVGAVSIGPDTPRCSAWCLS